MNCMRTYPPVFKDNRGPVGYSHCGPFIHWGRNAWHIIDHVHVCAPFVRVPCVCLAWKTRGESFSSFWTKFGQALLPPNGCDVWEECEASMQLFSSISQTLLSKDIYFALEKCHGTSPNKNVTKSRCTSQISTSAIWTVWLHVSGIERRYTICCTVDHHFSELLMEWSNFKRNNTLTSYMCFQQFFFFFHQGECFPLYLI